MRIRKIHVLFSVLFAVFVDFFSKYVVYEIFYNNIGNKLLEGVSVFENKVGCSLFISPTFNTGAAWGLLSNQANILLMLRVFMVISLFSYICIEFRKKSLGENILALTVIFSGALGNIVDRFRYGAVLDFISLKFGSYYFAVFNIADVWICLGCFIIMINFFIKPKH